MQMTQGKVIEKTVQQSKFRSMLHGGGDAYRNYKVIEENHRVGVVHNTGSCHCFCLQAVTVSQDYVAGDTLDSRYGEIKLGLSWKLRPCWLVFTRSESTMQAFGRVQLPTILLVHGP